MCVEYEKLAVDECYTLTQRDLKYTLIHLQRRVLRTTISKFMCYLERTYEIKSTNVFGYSSISLGSEIDDHPGNLLIIEALNSDSSALDCWLAVGDVRSNNKGLLYDHLKGMSLEKMTKGQMMNFVKSQDKELVEARARISELERSSIELEQLRDENRRLKIRLETQLFVFAKSGRSREILPPSP